MGAATIVRAVAALLAVMALGAAPSRAQDVRDAHDAARIALVRLEVTGPASGSNPAVPAGTPLESKGTGFLISPDGLVLTSHHLLGTLESDGVDGTRVEIRGTPERTGIETRRVAIVNAISFLDLLLLKLPTPAADRPYPHLELGTAAPLRPGDRIYGHGYPEGGGPTVWEGGLTSKDSARGHLWTVGARFRAGFSGAPLYREDGVVIGVVKGAHADGDVDEGYFVPIQFADPLIAHLRLSQLSDRVGLMDNRFEAVARATEWSGAYSESGRDVLIRYDKLVDGPPHVDEITCKLTYSIGSTFDRVLAPRPRTPDEFTQQRVGGGGDSAFGEFRFPGLGERLSSLKDALGETAYDKIECRFRPALDDGTDGRTQVISFGDPPGASQ